MYLFDNISILYKLLFKRYCLVFILFLSALPIGSIAFATEQLSLLVLPPALISDLTSLGWISQGIQDAMTVDLWKVPTVRTLAISEYIQTAGDTPRRVSLFTAGEACDLGRRSKVKHIWRGDVTINDKSRIIVRYTAYNCESRSELFSVSAEGDVTQVLSLASKIVLSMLAKENILVSSEVTSWIESIKTSSMYSFEQNATGYEYQQEISYRRRPSAQMLTNWITILERAVKADPQYAEARVNLGWAYRASGQSDKAKLEFTEALKLKPYLFDAWMGVAAEERAQGAYLNSLKSMSHASVINPSLEWPSREIISLLSSATTSADTVVVSLTTHERLDVRLEAFKALKRIRREGALPLLIQAMDRPDQAFEVLKLIVSIKPAEAIPFVIEALDKRNIKDGSRLCSLPESVLLIAIRQFPKFRAFEGVHALKRALDDYRPAVREEAALALGDLGVKDSIEILVKMAETDSNIMVNVGVRVALISLGHEPSRQILKRTFSEGVERNAIDHATLLMKRRGLSLTGIYL